MTSGLEHLALRVGHFCVVWTGPRAAQSRVLLAAGARRVGDLLSRVSAGGLLCMRNWGHSLFSQCAPDNGVPMAPPSPTVFLVNESQPWPLETPFITCPQATGGPLGGRGQGGQGDDAWLVGTAAPLGGSGMAHRALWGGALRLANLGHGRDLNTGRLMPS